MRLAIRSTLLSVSMLALAAPALAQEEEEAPQPLPCDADDTCAAPLACNTELEEPLCYYAEQSCESDDDCAASFECVAGEDFATGECVECEPADEGEEPVCTEVPCEPPPDHCFPLLIACEEDGDCPQDWGCRELTLDYVAPHWSEDVLGTLGCVPGGTLQLSEGNYYIGGFETLDGSIVEAMPLTGGAAESGGPMSTSIPSASGEPRADDGDDADGAPGSEAGSGCSVRRGAQSSSLWLALAALALGLRRRATRSI